MQYVFNSYLANQAAHALGRISRMSLPKPVLTPFIHLYGTVMNMNMDELAEPRDGFRSFSDFFGRRLKPESRPICGDSASVVSPCDGTVIDFGRIDEAGSNSFSIKGSRYTADEILGASNSDRRFRGGGYFVIYLHPRNYHRVHVPADAALIRVRHVPGARFPLFGWFEERVDCIYARNERVVFDFSMASGGVMSLIMVAAFGVGNISTKYAPNSVLKGFRQLENSLEPPVALKRGQEVGAFLLGSTVVTLWSKGSVELDKNFFAGPISMGVRIGTLNRFS